MRESRAQRTQNSSRAAQIADAPNRDRCRMLSSNIATRCRCLVVRLPRPRMRPPVPAGAYRSIIAAALPQSLLPRCLALFLLSARVTVKRQGGAEEALDSAKADIFPANEAGMKTNDHTALIHLNEVS